jgi:hypothetical protein
VTDPTAGNAGDYLVGRFAATQNDLPYAAHEFAAALAREPGDPELQQQAFLASLLAGSRTIRRRNCCWPTQTPKRGAGPRPRPAMPLCPTTA